MSVVVVVVVVATFVIKSVQQLLDTPL